MSERRDLEASLAEMDRKLRELQRELALVAGHGEPGEAAAPAPPPPREDRVAGVVEEAVARVSELGRRIDELARLREDLDRATQELRAEYRARGAPASREVVLDAGPFPDIATLGEFERALAGLEGVEDAAVRSFEGNRAIVDARVRAGLDLDEALRSLAREQGGGLTLHLRSGA